MTARPRIGIVCPTLNAEALLPGLLAGLQPAIDSGCKLLFVDSSSSDRTQELIRAQGIGLLVVPRNEFNHGETRELARQALHCDIVVMITQDVIFESNQVVQTLVQPIVQGLAVATYARQIPHRGAGFFEAFPRNYNYGTQSLLKGQEDLERLGSFVYFCSDSCAAWLNSALDEIGGFPVTLTNEDAYAAAALIGKGYRIAYVAEAVVRHSHRYSLRQEFERYFDTGYARRVFGRALLMEQKEERHGQKFVRAMCAQLWQERPWMLPYGFFVVLSKWLGYKIGFHGARLPIWLRRALSGQKYYWTSRPFVSGREMQQLPPPRVTSSAPVATPMD